MKLEKNTELLQVLKACASSLEEASEKAHVKSRIVLKEIRQERAQGEQKYNSKIFTRMLEKMTSSSRASKQVVARYILHGKRELTHIFPFAIKEEAGTVPRASYFPASNGFDATLLERAQRKKVAYIANIPVVLGENFKNNDRLLKRVLDGFKKEAFGATKKASIEKSRSRVAIVFGANRFKSIEKSKNRAFKNYLKNIEKDPDIQSSTVAFLWRPHWEKKGTEEGASVEISLVREYYKCLKNLDPKLAERCRLDREHPEGGINDRVPYQEIRDKIRRSQVSKDAVTMFRQDNRNREIYLAVMDPDFLCLRNDGAGLFTHYNRLIKSHRHDHGIAPVVASTGYQAADDENAILRYGIKLDMRVREAVARVLPLAVYFPEPNLIISIPVGHSTLRESFINRASINQESRQVIAAVLRERQLQDHKAALAFRSIGSLTTKIPPRFITETNSKDITKHQIGNLATLKALSGTRQSILRSIWGWSMSIEQVISVQGPAARSALSQMYALFSPIKLAKSKFFDFTARYSSKRHFESTLDKYENYANILSEVVDLFCARGSNHTRFTQRQDIEDLIQRAVDVCDFPGAREAFTTQITHLMRSYNTLSQMGLSRRKFELVMKASENAGRAIHETLIEILS